MDNQSVYAERKLGYYESTYKESMIAKPQDVNITITPNHIFGVAYIWEQKGTKEEGPDYMRFTCGLEEITKIEINTNNKNSPIYIQCDDTSKSVITRKRIILPSFKNNDEIVKVISEAKAELDKKLERKRAEEKNQKLKELESRKKAVDDEFENLTSGYEDFRKSMASEHAAKSAPKPEAAPKPEPAHAASKPEPAHAASKPESAPAPKPAPEHASKPEPAPAPKPAPAPAPKPTPEHASKPEPAPAPKPAPAPAPKPAPAPATKAEPAPAPKPALAPAPKPAAAAAPKPESAPAPKPAPAPAPKPAPAPAPKPAQAANSAPASKPAPAPAAKPAAEESMEDMIPSLPHGSSVTVDDILSLDEYLGIRPGDDNDAYAMDAIESEPDEDALNLIPEEVLQKKPAEIEELVIPDQIGEVRDKPIHQKAKAAPAALEIEELTTEEIARKLAEPAQPEWKRSPSSTPKPAQEAAPKPEPEPEEELEPIIEKSGVEMSLDEFEAAMKKLKSMLDSGVITEGEFAREKRKLLSNLY